MMIVNPSRFAVIGGTSAASLMHFDGADGSTTFTDETGKAWSRLNDAQIDTAQSKFGGASLLLDGGSDYVRSDSAHTEFGFGTGDFTMELFVRHSTVAVAFYFDMRPYGSNGTYPCLFANANGSLSYFVSSAARISAPAATVVAGTWHHVAVCRASGSTRLFVDGVQVGSTYTDATNYLAERITLGGGNQVSVSSLNGHIDEFRVIKGIALYTTTFTPPAAPFT